MKKETKVKTNITVYLIKKPSSESSKKLLNESFINYSQTLLDPDSTDNSKLISIDENTIIYYVDSKDSEPKWITSFFNDKQEAISKNIIFTSNAKVLLIKQVAISDNESRIFCMPFGYGKSMLKNDVYEEQFGLKVVLNSIDYDKVRSLSKTDIGSSYKKSKEQMPKESTINDFGFDFSMNLIKEVSAKSGDIFDNVIINGSDSFSLSTANNLNNIDDLLIKIYNQYNLTEYQKHFDWIDNIKLVKDSNLITKLNNKAVDVINNREFNKLWFAFPNFIDWQFCEGFIITGDKNIYNDIDNDVVLDSFPNGKIEDFSKLESKEIKMQITDKPNPKSYKASRCIVGSIEYENCTYSIDDGKWYKINEGFEKEVNEYYKNNILVSSLNFIGCPGCYTEDEYNTLLKDNLKGSKLTHTMKISFKGGSGNNIEPCDLIADHNLIFIKKNKNSSELSHLFNQASVSSNAFKDEKFRNELRKKAGDNDIIDSEDTFNSSNYTVVLGIIGDNYLDKPHIPFFSKVSLRDISKTIQNLGYKFYVKSINKVIVKEEKKAKDLICKLKEQNKNTQEEFIKEFKFKYQEYLSIINQFVPNAGITSDEYLEKMYDNYKAKSKKQASKKN